VGRIEAGYCETTPGGGVHWLYRSTEVAGNTRLACRPKRREEMAHRHDKVQVLIETRGEGGYAILAPSNGRVHPTGGAYRLVSGGVTTIAHISAEERQALWDLARTFDQTATEREMRTSSGDGEAAGSGRPGDAFNRRATWAEVLEPHGWQEVYRRGDVGYWRRPGKDRGVSATTNHTGRDTLLAFSTSTPFETVPASYSKFSVYATLNHGGDFRAAAQALGRQGYRGDTSRRAGPVSSTDPPVNTAAPSVGLPAVPPFPVAMLPRPLRRFVVEAAIALDCPSDLVAMPLLAELSGVAGNRYSVALKGGWTQRPILWVAVVAHPGSAKTPAQDAAQVPLEALQREAHERNRADLLIYEQGLAAWQATEKQSRGEKPQRPEEEHFYTTDSTIEAVARMLGADGSRTPGFVVIRDELVGWVRGFDAYKAGRGGERQAWLSLWAGKGFKSDRAGRESYFVPEPAVSVCGGIQPDALATLQAEAGQRDGFLERFCWVYPDTRPMRWTDGIISQQARDTITGIFRNLRAAGAPGVVGLAPAARWMFRAWVNENADAQERVVGLLRGVYAKLPNQAARLALALHLAEHSANPTTSLLSAEMMANALALVEYLRAHAHRVMTHFGAAAAVENALSIRAWQVLLRADDWVRMADLHRELGGHVHGEALRHALAELEAAGLAAQRLAPPGAGGGRPGEEWRASLRGQPEAQAQSQVNSVSSVYSQDVCPVVCDGCGQVLEEAGRGCRDCEPDEEWKGLEL
jgi:hypothetical protein